MYAPTTSCSLCLFLFVSLSVKKIYEDEALCAFVFNSFAASACASGPWYRCRWWLRQGHASLKVTSSKGHASAKATVLMFAKLRASLMEIAEASVVDAFAVKNAN
ncbi:hypothetical protein EZV62_008315 [Acer yangbiense]|uniref:Secreted protein n=1 Tax=Acer yangbiense TaxID=1000413 RepID=A0A5C7ICH7_9ROSI|nr:hypothetical protein EZV62_008315 [Acer yangbiense]